MRVNDRYNTDDETGRGVERREKEKQRKTVRGTTDRRTHMQTDRQRGEKDNKEDKK